MAVSHKYNISYNDSVCHDSPTYGKIEIDYLSSSMSGTTHERNFFIRTLRPMSWVYFYFVIIISCSFNYLLWCNCEFFVSMQL